MSDALVVLNEGLREVDDLEALVQLKTGGSRGPTAGIAAARRSAVLLINAHFEAYLEDVLEEALNAINDGFSADRLRRDFTTPRVDNINNLFSLIGIDRIAMKPSRQRAGNKAIRKAIDELQNARNAIAHGERAMVTKSKVRYFRTHVVGFSKSVDRIVANRVEEMTGAAPW